MNQTEQQFFALLRSGLWNTPADATLFSGSTDWNAIFTHSLHQTVTGLVAEGVNTLPAALQPPQPLLVKMHTRTTAIIRTHALLNRALADVVALFEANSIRPVLLKGQGVALAYTEPTLRQCGDIDLYIGRHDYDRAVELVCGHYGTDEHATESEKHYHFRHESGVTIELHRIAERLPLPWQDLRFQCWTEEHLLCAHRLRPVPIYSVVVRLPPADFDALYIFNHAWHHFSAGGGIGLRQLCDWARHLHTFHHEIDHAQLKRHLKDFGLWRAWRIFGCIAVDALGMPAGEFPFYTDKYARQARQILRMIGQEGNFGFYDPTRTQRPPGYLAGKMHTLVWMHRRFGRLLGTHFGQVAAGWAYYIYKGIGQVMKDLLTPKKKKQA